MQVTVRMVLQEEMALKALAATSAAQEEQEALAEAWPEQYSAQEASSEEMTMPPIL